MARATPGNLQEISRPGSVSPQAPVWCSGATREAATAPRWRHPDGVKGDTAMTTITTMLTGAGLGGLAWAFPAARMARSAAAAAAKPVAMPGEAVASAIGTHRSLAALLPRTVTRLRRWWGYRPERRYMSGAGRAAR